MSFRTLAPAAALLFSAAPAAADPLPALGAVLDGATVSGISSGAYMAGQFHVAFSSFVEGAGLVAGGPYGCAEGVLLSALQRCMDTTLGLPDPAHLVARAEDMAADGAIDPLAALADDSVYVFSGTEDHTVTPPVAGTVPEFYRLAGVADDRIEVVDDIAAGHAFITLDTGNACAETAPPFVNDCDYDQAGAILAALAGPLDPPSAAPEGQLLAFDQAAFLPGPAAHGMDPTGFVYVPDACTASPGCRVHVAFHGCRQPAPDIGTAFTEGAGYNRWADANRLIVLYPQTHASSGNPNACWDWWGYDDAGYDTRSGRQMAAVRAMLDRLADPAGSTPDPGPDPTCASFEATNFGHWQAGRAEVCNFWFLCATGSGETLGWPVATTTLFESPPGSFSTTACGG